MPQLDKLTLFSQVFWLISLYFLFFIGYTHYYLPYFSKLFKTRAFLLKQSLFLSNDLLGNSWSSSHAATFISILLDIFQHLSAAKMVTFKHYHTMLAILLISSFKNANLFFINKYLINTIKFEVSKKVLSKK